MWGETMSVYIGQTKKVLIIKLGYSETLDPEIGVVPSLGDVVRTTPLLTSIKQIYPDSHVTWLTDSKAAPLLDGIPQIDRLLVWDSFVPYQITYEEFDVLINLEKVPGICAIADQIQAWQKFGFRFDRRAGTFMAYAGGEEAFLLCVDSRSKRENPKPWQQVLVEMIGGTWSEQPYILPAILHAETEYDVGLNYLVGSKWPDKAWPIQNWEELAGALQNKGLTISWQEGKNDLKEYMKWISSCRLIVTCDSLGLHLALGMEKKVVVMYGPTSENETFLYNRGKALVSEQAQCRPCFSSSCRRERGCLEDIHAESVCDTVLQQMPPYQGAGDIDAPAAALFHHSDF